MINVTNILLAATLAVVVRQFYPNSVETLAYVAIALPFAYGLNWLFARYPAQRAEQKQADRDNKEYWRMEEERAVIRRSYETLPDWDSENPRPEYLAEVRELNLRHRDMLQRRNQWTGNDFDQGD